MPICKSCGLEKPEEDFYFRNKQKGTRRSNCKECHNNYQKKKVNDNKSVLEKLKLNLSCEKCGEKRPYCLDFHHINRENKSNTVSRLIIHSSLKDALIELKKCICLCSNCHREFHYLEQNNNISLNEYLFTNNYKTNKIISDFVENQEKIIIKNKEQKQKIRENSMSKKTFCEDCKKETYKGTLCPECSAKRRRKVERPAREELKKLIRIYPFTKIAQLFDVTDNAIRKWCDSYNLPRKKKDIKKISDEDWSLI